MGPDRRECPSYTLRQLRDLRSHRNQVLGSAGESQSQYE